MTSFWTDRAATTGNLRLFVPRSGWVAWADKVVAPGGTIEAVGSKEQIESAFLNALNATNLLFLTGAGASYAARNTGEGAVQAPSMGDLWNAVQAKVGKPVLDAVCSQFSDAAISQNIEKLLSLCKIWLELHDGASEEDDTKKRTKQFVKDAEQSILSSVGFVGTKTSLDAHTAVVRKIGRRGVRKPRTKIFTTNYDLCFEEAARRLRFTVVDGFSHSLTQTYDRSHFDLDIVRREFGKDVPDYISNVLHLYKLHGSVDWRRISDEIVRSHDQTGAPVLIYPRSSKYQEAFEPPYLDMFGSFQAALREPDTALIVSGFGFNDDHISRPVLAAIEANMSLRVVICDPAFIPAPDPTTATDPLTKGDHIIADEPAKRNPFLAQFHKLVSSGDPRIHLMNGRFSDMALALPDLVGETDRERHASRIRSLREPETR